MVDDLPKIGDESWSESQTVFELVIKDNVPFVDPKNYGLDGESINPLDYFVTSGDALEKAKILEKDLWTLAGKLRRQLFELLAAEHNCSMATAQQLFRKGTIPTDAPRFNEFEQAVWKAAGAARTLVANLRRTKGDNCFLETEWDNHRLLCITKNPRP